jgi:hypothetical protein
VNAGINSATHLGGQRCGNHEDPGNSTKYRKLAKHRPLLAQYLFDSLHDWHLKVLLVAAIIGHLAHIFFEGLQIKDAVVAFGIVITAEPRGDEPRLTDFVMHELVTVDFRNVDRHLGVARPGGCKGKDGYQGDADALPWHKILLSRNRNFRKATHLLYRFCQPLGKPSRLAGGDGGRRPPEQFQRNPQTVVAVLSGCRAVAIYEYTP